MDAGPRRGIQSVEVAAGILGALSRAQAPLSLSALAREAALPPSKAHRYLVSLIECGLVRQDTRSGQYDLGRAAMALGIAAISRSDVVNEAADALRPLSIETGSTVMLSVWADHGPTVVRWERAAGVLVSSLGLGSILPLLNSATGKVFLSYLPRPVTQQVLDREIAGPAGGAAGNGEIDALISGVRETGVATVDGRLIPGLHAIAAPVLNWQDEADAVVTLVSAAGTMDKSLTRRKIRLLKQTCRQLSRSSG